MGKVRKVPLLSQFIPPLSKPDFFLPIWVESIMITPNFFRQLAKETTATKNKLKVIMV